MTARPAGAVRMSPFYNAEHEAFRESLRRFVAKEIEPFTNAWDEAGEFPREIYKKAAAVGYMGLGFPEAYGGTEGDRFMRIIAMQEIARAGCGGLGAGLFSHTIGAPPILHRGSEALKARVLPQILSGDKISALAITEPSGGSDVANLRTTARRDGDHFVVNGSKTFITSGMRADFITLAVRTGGPGASGVSLLLVEGQPEGLQRTPLKKMGWWCSDTATLYFDNLRVPVDNLIGKEGEGFKAIMLNFNDERLHGAAGAISAARVCLDEATAYAKQRVTFGKPISQHQVIRHKLVDMAMRVEASQAMLELLTWRLENGENPVAEICMLKNQATTTMAYCASEGVQIFGGAGFLRGAKVERIYREVKVNAIGGGTEEIMKDLASRQMGL
ncbi:MAG TPA: acyl-CoA dehydrogenase family protein [Roseiarcus sp.]|nr:acyl-CoA dehydrogenase family protein [Roseiarcus sp.]